MKNALVAGAVVVALSAAAAGQKAVAHHAFAAEFDGAKPVLLKGPVTKKEWINPHAWIHLKDEKTGQAWMVEGGPPATLIRGGLTKDSLPNGTVIIVRGYMAKDKRCAPACKANGRDVTFSDGRKVFMGSSGGGEPRDGADRTER